MIVSYSVEKKQFKKKNKLHTKVLEGGAMGPHVKTLFQLINRKQFTCAILAIFL